MYRRLFQITISILLSAVVLTALPISAQTVRQTCSAGALTSDDFTTLIEQAAYCLELGQRNAELAQRYLDQAISLQPDQVQAYSLRVEAYFWQQQIGYAIADATLAIYLEPSDSLLLARRAFLFSVIEDWRSALTDLDRAIALDAANAELIAQAAGYASVSEQPELAINYLVRGLEAEPENESLLVQLGDVYYEMDDRTRALETYRTYLALTRSPSELVRARVLILERDA